LAHVLLEQLPEVVPSARREAAARLAEAYSGGLSAEPQRGIVEEVLRLLEMPALLPIFGPGARAEVAIAGRLARADGRMVPITGRIDRLALTPTEVILVDFKTGSLPASGELPRDYAAQLALYRALGAPLYPDKEVRALLVWTREPRVVEVGAVDLDAALARTLAQ
jgi:ATP-dependent helicase/nuclease subunit A